MTFAVAAILGAVAWATPAEASPRSRLFYSRSREAEACPDEAALHRAVIERVGYDPFFAWADRTVIASIAKHKTELVGKVEIVDANGIGQGVREITASATDCGALVETIALTIAIAIDPHAVAPRETPSAASPTLDEVTPPSPAVDAPSPAVDAPAADARPLDAPPSGAARRDALPAPAQRASSVGLRVAGTVRGEVGTEPGPAPGLAASVAIERSRFALGLEIASLLPSTTGADAPNLSRVRVRGWLLRSSVLPCVRFAKVNVCGLVSVGRFEGSAENALEPTSRASAFVAAGARVGLEVPLSGRLAMTFDGELAANLYRTTLAVGAEQVWTAPPVGGGLGIGIAARF
ncbi:MAG TPA: hypothetical protein VM580_14390 [Labilithrix sp.]|jgi:hypothetical protein|nr:hypothetical protein [Labilithrix sp.]